MTVQDLEAEVLKLPAEDRARIAETLLASLPPSEEDEGDPIDGLGKNPVRGGSREETDVAARAQPAGKRSIWGLDTSPVDCGGEEEDPIDGLGKNPVITGVTDGSVAHDRYLYGSPPA